MAEAGVLAADLASEVANGNQSLSYKSLAKESGSQIGGVLALPPTACRQQEGDLVHR